MRLQGNFFLAGFKKVPRIYVRYAFNVFSAYFFELGQEKIFHVVTWLKSI